MSATMALRKEYKDLFEKKHGVKLGFMSFFATACVSALREHPGVNAYIVGDEVEYHDDGSVTLAGLTLAPDEVEILATPRPGTAVAHDEGIVVVIDTESMDALPEPIDI